MFNRSVSSNAPGSRLADRRCGFARWLVQTGRLREDG
jgi:hypothetical protein